MKRSDADLESDKMEPGEGSGFNGPPGSCTGGIREVGMASLTVGVFFFGLGWCVSGDGGGGCDGDGR